LAAVTILTAGPAAAALDNGEAAVSNQPTLTGTTALATDVINLPNSFVDEDSGSSASASVFGPMADIELDTAANIRPFVSSLQAVAQVDFVDSLFVEAAGVDSGTGLIVEVAWQVDGSTGVSGGSLIRSQGRLQLDNLNGTQWRRATRNFAAPVEDPLGTVVFPYPVMAGQIEMNNIRLRAVAEAFCGLPGSVHFAPWNESASAGMTVQFLGAVNVTTADGTELLQWTTSSESGLVYGFRDDLPPPSKPRVRINPSTGGGWFTSLSWPSVSGEFYTVLASGDLLHWREETEVLGTGNVIHIDLFRGGPARFFKLAARVGPGHPADQPEPALLLAVPFAADRPFIPLTWSSTAGEACELLTGTNLSHWQVARRTAGNGQPLTIYLEAADRSRFFRLVNTSGSPAPTLRAGPKVTSVSRFAWQTRHWENYRLEYSEDLRTWRPETRLNGNGTVSGTGGAVYFDLPATSKWRFYRVASWLK